MMGRGYQPFVITLEERGADGFSIRAKFQGSTWSATIPPTLHLLTLQEIQQALQWLERGFIDRDYARDFGRRLFQTLFQGDILSGFRTATERTAVEKSGLRIVLTLPQSPINAAWGDLSWEDLPWELMYDEDGGHGFLARSTTAPLVRHFEVPVHFHTLPERGPLRILIVTASPSGYALVSSDEEVEKIRRSLTRHGIGFLSTVRLLGQHLRHTRSLLDFVQRLRHKNWFEVDILPHATWPKLQEQIRQAETEGRGYHVVHFVGHGQVDDNGGHLVFEAENDEAYLLPSDAFAEILAEPSVNLAVLNACQTASAGRLFHGVAQATLQRGVPAVIGMQVPILDQAAVDFAQEFYGAWAAGQPIEGALAYARRLIKEETPGAAADWSIPVLFMGPDKGLTLEMELPPPSMPPVVRFLRWVAASFISLLGLISLLLTIPAINQQLRTEVPIVRCVFPYPMESGYNVVVTPFTVLDENGSIVRSRQGQAVADYLYQQLDFNFTELNLKLPYDIRPPVHTCSLKGSTSAEREARAAELAEAINADLVVYGTLTDAGAQSWFSPEFYVNYKGFEEGEEITGQHRLGKALRMDLPFDADRYSPVDNPAFTARTEALTLMTIGLSYFSIDDFEEATAYFTQAEMIRGWLDNAGKEVIYLLLGNAMNRRATQENNTAYLEAAGGYFDQALVINPTYARAMVGKAGVLYLTAIGDSLSGSADKIGVNELDEAAALYEEARNLANQPESANIETKVHFGLGQVNFGRFIHAWATDGNREIPLAQAKAEFQQVIDEYNAGNVRVANLAGHANARLGLMARINGETEDAASFYQQAIDLVSPFHQSYYYTRKGEAYADDGQIENAIMAYEQAIAIAEFQANAEQVTEYTDRLNELKAFDNGQ